MILSLNRTKVPVYGETKCLVINKNYNNNFDSSNSVIYYTTKLTLKVLVAFDIELSHI